MAALLAMMVAGEREPASRRLQNPVDRGERAAFLDRQIAGFSQGHEIAALERIGAALEHAHAFCRHHGVAGPKRRVVEYGAGVIGLPEAEWQPQEAGFASEALILATNWE